MESAGPTGMREGRRPANPVSRSALNARALASAPRADVQYGMELADVLRAVRQGRGREALAFYERAAEEAERGGSGLAIARAHRAVAYAAFYLAAYEKAIRSGLRASTMLVRGQATETQVKTLGEQAGVLHFATHAELDEKDPLSSALLLVPDEDEDGRLEVREIFGLDLKAKLVVLSACETGLGQLSKGDELVGLQRAFLYAGTPAVVTTLWKVDDRASYYLMRAFYDHLETLGPAAALRDAQRASMRDFPHPFAWAGFGLTGVPK